MSYSTKSTRLFYVVGGLFLLVLGGFSLFASFDNGQPFYFGILVSIVFIVFGLICCHAGIYWQTMTIEDGQLKIKVFDKHLKKSIEINQIKAYSVIQKKNKYLNWEELTIHMSNATHTISSLGTPNYHEIKSRLIENAIEDTYPKKLWKYKIKRRHSLWIVSVGLVLIILTIVLKPEATFIYSMYILALICITYGTISGLRNKKPAAKNG